MYIETVNWMGEFLTFFFFLRDKFFSLKNRKLFLKTKNKRKKQFPNVPLVFFIKKKKKVLFVAFNQISRGRVIA